MTEPIKRKRLRSVVLNGDGSTSDSQTIEYYPLDIETGETYAGDENKPGVGFTLRKISPAEWRDLQARHTARTVDPDTKSWVEKVDRHALTDEVMQTAIVGWWGFDGADGKPLVCTEVTKPLVPDVTMRAEIQWRSTRVLEVTEVERDASFREPA